LCWQNKNHTELPSKQKALDLKGRLNQHSTLATGGWVAERPKMIQVQDLLVPVTWKRSMPQENNAVSGFSWSSWLRRP